ncbi:MAG: AraC family transcriptional regulator [Paenibacillus sp.]|nr:AraC family transcriptional regulator [Paenibacillus sp.]
MNEPQLPIEAIRFRMTKGCGKRICEPGWYWDHQTPFHDYDLFYVVNGQGTMRLGDEQFELQPKCCIIMRPGDLPKATMDENNRLTVLYLHFCIDIPPADETEAPFPFPRFTKMDDYVQMENRIHQIMDVMEFPSLWADFQFDILMKLVFLSMYKQHVKSNESPELSPKQIHKVRKVITYIREEQGRQIDFAKLAELAGMSQQYLNRLFKSFTGQSLKEFIMHTKLRYAMHLLEQSTMSVSEVAYALGYADVYTFSKRFKYCHGISPSHYIAQIRPARSVYGKGTKKPR